MTQHIEPVAWMNDHGAVTSFEHGRKAWESSGITSTALIRLSDAQAALAAAEERGRMEERELAQKVINEMGRIIGNLQAELDKGKTP